MLSEKSSQETEKGFLGRFVALKQRQIAETNPDRIYVETVRSFFHFPTAVARLLLELGVREGAFEKRVGILCPNQKNIIEDFAPEELPETITCVSCMASGMEEYEFNVSDCKTIDFYRLCRAHSDE